MTLNGQLQQFSLARLLNQIQGGRKSGALSIDSVEGEATLYFERGVLIDARRGGQPEPLVEAMRRADRLEPAAAALFAALSQRQHDKEAALLLINGGLATKEEIVSVARDRVMALLHWVLDWEEGTFVFDQSVAPDPGHIPVAIPLDGLIVWAERIHAARADEDTSLPSRDAIPRLVAEPGVARHAISLSADEWRVISFIEPPSPIAEIAQRAQLSEYAVRQIIATLAQQKLVEITSSATPAASTTPTTDRSSSLTLHDTGTSQRDSTPPPEPRAGERDKETGILNRLRSRIQRD